MRMRAFVLVRDEDVTGVSGTGHVAEGLEFSDGTVALRWLSDWPTSVVFHDRGIESVEFVHGHSGKTRIVWQMRVLVCGSRDFDDAEVLNNVLDGFDDFGERGITTLIEGESAGADVLARRWAEVDACSLIEVLKFPADWSTYNKAAGPIRNRQMLYHGRPDLVIAFVNKPLLESRGTHDMVTRAREAGVKTIVVEVMR